MSSMRSTFFGLEIGRTGLFVSQRQLDVTGHNIANTETLGYTRQRAATASIDPYNVLMRYAPMERGLVGGGVEVLHVEQIRDKFLDIQIRQKNAQAYEWDARASALFDIESLFDEIKASNTLQTGLFEMLANFVDKVKGVHTDQEEYAIRVDMKTSGQMLVDKFHEYYDELLTQQKALDDKYDLIATRINNIAESIAEYNERIFGFELTGEFANDLRDKRNLLLDELSTLVDIQSGESGSPVPGTPGKLWVTIGGEYLVDYKTVNKVIAVADKTNPIDGEAVLRQLKWDNGTATGGNLVKYTTGKLKGIELIRDSDRVDEMGIPYVVGQLNLLASRLVDQFNSVHEKGYTFPYEDLITGTTYASKTGVLFFGLIVDSPGPPTTYKPVTAKNISLSQDVKDSPYNIAMSSDPVYFNDPAHPNNHTGNRDNGIALAELVAKKTTMGNTSFEGYLAGMVVELGSKADYANKTVTAHADVCMMLENQRQSISGVSLDEEMTNMVKFQHAYNGAARIITTMDEALDKLINHTGNVGLA